MTCEEYRTIVEARKGISEEIADQMDEHDFQCDEYLNCMFIEIFGVDPDIETEELIEQGKEEGWL